MPDDSLNCLRCGTLFRIGPDLKNKVEIYDSCTDETKTPKSFWICNSILFVCFLFISIILIINNYFFEGINTLISFVLVISIQKLFIKANIPWYIFFISGYNIYLFLKLVFIDNSGIFLLSILFGIHIILYLCGLLFPFSVIDDLLNIVFLLYKVYLFIILFLIGLRFGKNPTITAILFPIMIPLIAFSKKTTYKTK